MDQKNACAANAASVFSIKKAAVIGAGTMGAGIAAYLAGAGLSVCLLDSVPSSLTPQEKEKGLTIHNPAVRNRFAQAGKDRVCDPKRGVLYDPDHAYLIQVGNVEDDLEQLRDCDWVVEAIYEDLQAKKDLLNKIVPHCGDHTLLTSNTSGVSITSIVEDMPLSVRKRFMGTHFFNPPRYMRLFELIPGADTCPTLLEFMRGFAETRLGKGVVLAKDTPNFIANRIGVYNSSTVVKCMLKYGLNFDQADQLTGPVMGKPKTASFRTSDLVGLDISKAVSENLQKTLADPQERDYFKLEDFQLEMIANGQLGDKTGGGYYKKVVTPEGKASLMWDRTAKEYIPLPKQPVSIAAEALKEPSLGGKLRKLVSAQEPGGLFAWEVLKRVMLYSAAKVPEITDDFRQIDNAMRWGYNWQAGPFQIWDLLGVQAVISRMQAEGETVPAWVLERKGGFYETDAAQSGFGSLYPTLCAYDEAAVLDMGDGVLLFEAKSRGNAISTAVKDAILDAVDLLERTPEYQGMVIANAGKNFLNGANLKDLVQRVDDRQYGEIAESIDHFHATSMRLKYARKPIVAAVRGNALGGGLEFASHCHRVVAAPDSFMGLVEIRVGIIPGGGGIKELLCRAMEQASTLGISDYNKVIEKVFRVISSTAVSRSAFEAKRLGLLRATDRIVMNPDQIFDAAREEVLRMVKDGFRCPIKKPVTVTGTTGRANLEQDIQNMLEGGFITAYDAVLFRELAWVLTGGDVPKGTQVSEEYLNELEKEGIVRLVHNEPSIQRLHHMVEKNKPLHN